VPARPPVAIPGALAGQHLARLRDTTTPAHAFRRHAGALSALVLAKALEDLEERRADVMTPLARASALVPARQVTLVPVLRAGLAMVEPALQLLPDDTLVGFLGMVRDERTLEPRTYFESLPVGLGEHEVVALDPMIATGGSSSAALRALRAAGARRLRLVGLIAAPEGLAAVAAAEPDVSVTVAAIDERLDERGFIVPGLGDAGDRLYAASAGA
jgi:uracil phosphoribosyltransferase